MGRFWLSVQRVMQGCHNATAQGAAQNRQASEYPRTRRVELLDLSCKGLNPFLDGTQSTIYVTLVGTKLWAGNRIRFRHFQHPDIKKAASLGGRNNSRTLYQLMIFFGLSGSFVLAVSVPSSMDRIALT